MLVLFPQIPPINCSLEIWDSSVLWLLIRKHCLILLNNKLLLDARSSGLDLTFIAHKANDFYSRLLKTQRRKGFFQFRSPWQIITKVRWWTKTGRNQDYFYINNDFGSWRNGIKCCRCFFFLWFTRTYVLLLLFFTENKARKTRNTELLRTLSHPGKNEERRLWCENAQIGLDQSCLLKPRSSLLHPACTVSKLHHFLAELTKMGMLCPDPLTAR